MIEPLDVSLVQMTELLTLHSAKLNYSMITFRRHLGAQLRFKNL